MNDGYGSDSALRHEGGHQPVGCSVEKRLPEQDERWTDQNPVDVPDRGIAHRPDQYTNRGADHLIDHAEDQGADHVPGQHPDRNANRTTAPLVKQTKAKTKPNDTKQIDDTDNTAGAFVFYQENFGPISPFVADALLHWVGDLGEALVLDAMKRALERGKSNWSYVKAILQAWAKKGITSVEAAKAEEAAFRRSRQERG